MVLNVRDGLCFSSAGLVLEETIRLASYSAIQHNYSVLSAPNVHQCWV